MKATGIVRRIDDLGRIVIPKEIRRTLRIRERDALEIFTDRDGEVILKKYSPIADLEDCARVCRVPVRVNPASLFYHRPGCLHRVAGVGKSVHE